MTKTPPPDRRRPPAWWPIRPVDLEMVGNATVNMIAALPPVRLPERAK